MARRTSRDAEPRRKAATQERILEAAVGLFLERGFERTSTAVIAARAGVSRSAIFWHFGDKENLFREAFRRVSVPFLEELKASLDPLAPRKRVFEMVKAYERVVEQHGTAVRSLVRWLFESEKLRASLLPTLIGLHDEFVADMRATFEELLDGRDEGDALAAAVVALLDGNLLLSMLDPHPRHLERRRRGLRRLLVGVVGETDDG